MSVQLLELLGLQLSGTGHGTGVGGSGELPIDLVLSLLVGCEGGEESTSGLGEGSRMAGTALLHLGRDLVESSSKGGPQIGHLLGSASLVGGHQGLELSMALQVRIAAPLPGLLDAPVFSIHCTRFSRL